MSEFVQFPRSRVNLHTYRLHARSRTMKPLPQVSVLMPVRDGERWLSASIDSVLQQTLTDFELIIVNDGSIDRTPAILESYVLRDQRIRVIHTDQKGVAV